MKNAPFTISMHHVYVIQSELSKTHVAAIWDHGAYNAGFVIASPTEIGLAVYEAMWGLTTGNSSIDDQMALNEAARILGSGQRRPLDRRTLIVTGNERTSAVLALSQRRFVCGVDYFERSVALRPYGDEWEPYGYGEDEDAKAGSGGCGRGNSWAKASLIGASRRPCADVVHNNWIVGHAAKVIKIDRRRKTQASAPRCT